MTVAIWGSCVTRDIFEVGGAWDAPLSYHARSSWVSQATAVGEHPAVTVPTGSGFGHRMVREDLNKSILAEAVTADPEMVIFDLIDERFDVVLHGDVAYTVSDYYARVDLEEPIRRLADRTIPFRDRERDDLFVAAVETLAPQWLAALPAARFALHQAWYTARSADPSHVFYESAPDHVEWSNRRLGSHFEAMRRAFGDRLHIIEPDPATHLVSDPGHKWGLAHFHYVPSYYEVALEQIREIAAGSLQATPPALVVPGPAESGSRGSAPAGDGTVAGRLRGTVGGVWRSAVVSDGVRRAVGRARRGVRRG